MTRPCMRASTLCGQVSVCVFVHTYHTYIHHTYHPSIHTHTHTCIHTYKHKYIHTYSRVTCPCVRASTLCGQAGAHTHTHTHTHMTDEIDARQQLSEVSVLKLMERNRNTALGGASDLARLQVCTPCKLNPVN